MPVITLTSKGQIVIPREIREELSLKPGLKLNASIIKGKILLEIIDHTAKLSDFRNKVRQHLENNQLGSVSDEQINQAKQSLWNQRNL